MLIGFSYKWVKDLRNIKVNISFQLFKKNKCLIVIVFACVGEFLEHIIG